MSDIIYTPPASSGGTTINPTNNFIPVRSNATTFVDSFILNDTANNLLQSDVTGGTFGFYFNGNNSQSIIGTYNNVAGLFIDIPNLIYSLGDIDNGNYITYNYGTFKSVYAGNDIGLLLDFTNDAYYLGDFNSVSSGTSIYIDVASSLIYTQHSGQQEGLLFDFVNDYFSIGDFNNTNNGTYLKIDDDNLYITTFYQGNGVGLKLEFANRYFQLGEFNNLFNYNYLSIDDLNNFIFLGNGKADSPGLKFQYKNNTNDCYVALGSDSDGIGFGCNFDSATITSSFLYLNSNYNLTLSSNNNAPTTITAFGTNINQLILDPSSDKMSFTTNNLNFVGASLIDANIVAPVAKNLLVTINGTIYHIPLYN